MASAGLARRHAEGAGSHAKGAHPAMQKQHLAAMPPPKTPSEETPPRRRPEGQANGCLLLPADAPEDRADALPGGPGAIRRKLSLPGEALRRPFAGHSPAIRRPFAVLPVRLEGSSRAVRRMALRSLAGLAFWLRDARPACAGRRRLCRPSARLRGRAANWKRPRPRARPRRGLPPSGLHPALFPRNVAGGSKRWMGPRPRTPASRARSAPWSALPRLRQPAPPHASCPAAELSAPLKPGMFVRPSSAVLFAHSAAGISLKRARLSALRPPRAARLRRCSGTGRWQSPKP